MKVAEETSGLGVAALLIMVAFVICSIVLLVYYVMRLVTLYLGAVLAPLVSLIWLIPGFRDFAETAFKTYLTTIFVLFVHVVILQLSASLFTGMATASGDNVVPDTLIAMVTGIATIIMLLRAQSVMMQFSYVSMGSRNLKKLGGQFMNGVSYMTGKTKTAAGAIGSKTDSGKKTLMMRNVESRAVSSGKTQAVRYKNKKGTAEITHTATPTKPRAKTGTTYEAPSVKVTRTNHPKNNSKDKIV
jgi:type IV secretory pathway TrbL component